MSTTNINEIASKIVNKNAKIVDIVKNNKRNYRLIRNIVNSNINLIQTKYKVNNIDAHQLTWAIINCVENNYIEREPQVIQGNWKAGWAIDLHTISSVKIDDSHFENTYSDIGKALNLLKYHDDFSQIEYLADCVVKFMRTNKITSKIAAIVPTPPSNLDRKVQPVYAIAQKVSEKLNIPLDTDYLVKTKNTSELKTIEDKIQRQEVLNGAFQVKDYRYQNKKVLLFDDLFRSGSTLNEITRTLYQSGNVKNVYVVTLTKTRANGLAKNISY